jgi:hypothetical protein
MTDPHRQVGTADPKLETSLIVGEGEEKSFPPNIVSRGCLFNGVEFQIGEFVRSGDELLRCELPGVWVRVGEWQMPWHKHPLGPTES